MKRLIYNILFASLCLTMAIGVPLTAQAQTDESLDAEFGARVSLSLDKKIIKRLHATLEEEIRFDDNFSGFNRFHTTVGVSYKVASFLKIGMGYALINPYNTEAQTFKDARHRLMLDATGSIRLGDWTLSLKERLQATHRTGSFNEYQNPRNALALKSRISAKYKGFHRLTPYAYIELRHYLNAPSIKATYDGTNYLTTTGSVKGDAGWFLTGFNSAYMNRLRGSLGIDYDFDKHNKVNLSFLADYISDKVVDANAEGTKLKSYTHETGFAGWICIGYEHAF